ncbi:hypothetical protein NGA74_12470 [Lactobacillus helveticus]|nr:hypothetical protein [Lactobacillus helveticus]
MRHILHREGYQINRKTVNRLMRNGSVWLCNEAQTSI